VACLRCRALHIDANRPSVYRLELPCLLQREVVLSPDGDPHLLGASCSTDSFWRARAGFPSVLKRALKLVLFPVKRCLSRVVLQNGGITVFKKFLKKKRRRKSVL